MEYLFIFAGYVGGNLLALRLADTAETDGSKSGLFWLLVLPLSALGIGAAVLLWNAPSLIVTAVRGLG